MPIEPPLSRFAFGDASTAPSEAEVLAVGGDLAQGTVLAAYRAGLFPMPVSRRGGVGWWSPDPRGVIPLDGLKISRSLRVSCRRYEIRVDTAYDEVMAGCADPRRADGWIRTDIVAAYRRLHDLGWVHSVEAWSRGPAGEDRLAGGLYGVQIGGLFAGESMFQRERDASKAALVGLVTLLRAGGAQGRVLDVQWVTPHLASLGAVKMPRADYIAALPRALALDAALPSVMTPAR